MRAAGLTVLVFDNKEDFIEHFEEIERQNEW